MISTLKERGHGRLSDRILWGTFVSPGIILNKDGSLQTTCRFRGPDLNSTTDEGLAATMARLNNALRRLGSGWAIHVEARRRVSTGYTSQIKGPAAAVMIDEERHHLFANSGTKLLTDYYLTLSYLLPEDRTAKASSLLYENKEATKSRQLGDEITVFDETVRGLVNLLGSTIPYIELLDDAATLTYLHDCVSWSPIEVTPPEDVQFIDSFLYDTDLLPGLEPMLGDRFLKTLAIQIFPSSTVPALLDRLNTLPFEYRWTTRYLCLSKEDAEAEIKRKQRQWFGKRKSLGRMIIETFTQQQSTFLNADAVNKANDATDALEVLNEDVVSFGYLTPVIVVWDENHERAKEKISLVQREIDGLGFVSHQETFNAVDAWLSSLPGHNWQNVRRPIVSSMNLSHMLPLSSVWSGEAWNSHLDAPALLVAETDGETPFYFNLHTQDVGHTMMIGPTGGGKSTFLSLLAAQFLRYDRAHVMFFDIGGSARAMTHAIGGHYCRLGDPQSMALQPLVDIDQAEEQVFALDWLVSLLGQEGVSMTPDRKEALWSALVSMAGFPREQRTITVFTSLLQDHDAKEALSAFTLDGPYGALLDAAETTWHENRWRCFDLEILTEQRGAIAPTLLAIFHKIEKEFIGEPTLLILDEAWLFLENSLFSARLKSWLKTLRKKNVSVVFATQSLADVEQSTIAATLIDSCPQKIFLPNPRGHEAAMFAFYQRFGLNNRQIDLITRATPKSEYYMVSPRGNRLFALTLGEIALALCGSSSPDDQRLMDRLLEQNDQTRFLAGLLSAKGLAADQTPTNHSLHLVEAE